MTLLDSSGFAMFRAAASLALRSSLKQSSLHSSFLSRFASSARLTAELPSCRSDILVASRAVFIWEKVLSEQEVLDCLCPHSHDTRSWAVQGRAGQGVPGWQGARQG